MTYKKDKNLVKSEEHAAWRHRIIEQGGVFRNQMFPTKEIAAKVNAYRKELIASHNELRTQNIPNPHTSHDKNHKRTPLE